MRTLYSGTAAALQFSTPLQTGFDDIVCAFRTRLAGGGCGQVHITHDCEDVAILDCGPIRVALGWVEPGPRQSDWYLVIAVSRSLGGYGYIDDPALTSIAESIIDQAGAHLGADNVFRCKVDRKVDTDFIDFVTEMVLNTRDESAKPSSNHDEDLSKHHASWSPYLLQGHSIEKEPPQPAVEEEDTEEGRLKQLRKVLTEVDQEKTISLPMHLTLYTFSLSMMLQVPSVGAALLVYNILREDSLPFL